jgi:carboxymethylenebutenolidase
MGQTKQLRATDGFAFGTYEAMPKTKPRGAVVVIQEIFGVNSHIRSVADGYAAAGYAAIAPQIFDRVERNVELGYEPDDMTRGVAIARGKLKLEQALQDVQAAIDDGKRFGKVGVVGYCFGGLVTWLAATDLSGVACAVSYYGGGVASQLDRKPKCPVMMHFGAKDAHIPLSDVDKVRKAQPGVTVHVYDADHGFNCDQRASYDAAAAKLALSRSLEFFAKHIA